MHVTTSGMGGCSPRPLPPPTQIFAGLTLKGAKGKKRRNQYVYFRLFLERLDMSIAIISLLSILFLSDYLDRNDSINR